MKMNVKLFLGAATAVMIEQFFQDVPEEQRKRMQKYLQA